MTAYQASQVKRLLDTSLIKKIDIDDTEVWATDKTGSYVDIYRPHLEGELICQKN